MQLIPIKERKGKTCCDCGATVSVKYTQDGHAWCNRCVCRVSWRHDDWSDVVKKDEETSTQPTTQPS